MEKENSTKIELKTYTFYVEDRKFEVEAENYQVALDILHEKLNEEEEKSKKSNKKK